MSNLAIQSQMMQILFLLLVIKISNGFFSSKCTQQNLGPVSQRNHKNFKRNKAAISNSLDLKCLKGKQDNLVRLSIQCPIMDQILMLRNTHLYHRKYKRIEDS